MQQTRHMASSRQAAGILGCSVRTVIRLAESGELPPAIKAPGLRGAYLFDPAVVKRVRDERAGQPVAS